MQYRSQSELGPPAKLARRLLQKMPVAQAKGLGYDRVGDGRRPEVRADVQV